MNNFLATDQKAIGTDQKAIIINEKNIRLGIGPNWKIRLLGS